MGSIRRVERSAPRPPLSRLMTAGGTGGAGPSIAKSSAPFAKRAGVPRITSNKAENALDRARHTRFLMSIFLDRAEEEGSSSQRTEVYHIQSSNACVEGDIGQLAVGASERTTASSLDPAGGVEDSWDPGGWPAGPLPRLPPVWGVFLPAPKWDRSRPRCRARRLGPR